MNEVKLESPEILLIDKYQRVKQTVDESRLLSPNENLITQNRGYCYWPDCNFQNDIEDNFKKHLLEQHPMSVQSLTQVELSFERMAQLSKSLLLEQNRVYNMLQHLDTHYSHFQMQQQQQQQRSASSIMTTVPALLADPRLALLLSRVTQFQHPQQQQQLDPGTAAAAAAHHLLADSLRRQQMASQQLPLFQPLQQALGDVSTTSSPAAADSVATGGALHHYPRSDSGSCHNNGVGIGATAATEEPRTNPKRHSSHSSTVTRPGTNSYPEGMTEREYYRTRPERPAASYVNLIKTAILESPKRELSLHEIYVWMQTEFAFFRDKEQKWKNAIRHNLSLHKCFERKHGKLWVFNEKEYNMKKSRNRFQYNIPVGGSENEMNEYTENEDNDEHQDNNDSEEYPIKQEMEFSVKPQPTSGTPQLQQQHISEWTAYLQKTPIMSTPLEKMNDNLGDWALHRAVTSCETSHTQIQPQYHLSTEPHSMQS